MGLGDLHIIAFCFFVHFTQHHNFFGTGVVYSQMVTCMCLLSLSLNKTIVSLCIWSPQVCAGVSAHLDPGSDSVHSSGLPEQNHTPFKLI